MLVSYALDPKASRFTVQAFATGVLSRLGDNPTFAVREYHGEVGFAADPPTDAFVQFTARSDSLILTDDVGAQDRVEIEGRMRREVLETAANPEIVFRSIQATVDRIAENWYRLWLTGDLRLHGVSKIHELDLQLRVLEEGLRMSGQTTLQLSAYRIKPITALAGMIKLKDELKIDFDLVAHKQG